jgi:hypothetical protein
MSIEASNDSIPFLFLRHPRRAHRGHLERLLRSVLVYIILLVIWLLRWLLLIYILLLHGRHCGSSSCDRSILFLLLAQLLIFLACTTLWHACKPIEEYSCEGVENDESPDDAEVPGKSGQQKVLTGYMSTRTSIGENNLS